MAQTATPMGGTRRRPPRFIPTLVRLWQGLKRDLTDSYRPERHYMRGPGPKWHAKHAT
jgi:hypothetical protein